VISGHEDRRSVNKTEEFFQPESPLYSQLASQTNDPKATKTQLEEEYFRARTPLKGEVSPENMHLTQDE